MIWGLLFLVVPLGAVCLWSKEKIVEIATIIKVIEGISYPASFIVLYSLLKFYKCQQPNQTFRIFYFTLWFSCILIAVYRSMFGKIPQIP
jgi:hypothetical protein